MQGGFLLLTHDGRDFVDSFDMIGLKIQRAGDGLMMTMKGSGELLESRGWLCKRHAGIAGMF